MDPETEINSEQPQDVLETIVDSEKAIDDQGISDNLPSDEPANPRKRVSDDEDSDEAPLKKRKLNKGGKGVKSCHVSLKNIEPQCKLYCIYASVLYNFSLVQAFFSLICIKEFLYLYYHLKI